MATRGRPKGSTTKGKSYPADTTPPKRPEKTEAKIWLERIDRAKKVKEEWQKMFRVDLAYEYFEGRHKPAHIPSREWITVNLIYSDLRTMLPALYSTDPYYYVKLKRSFHPNPMDVALYELRAKIRQSMLNYLKGEVKLKSKSRMAIFDAMFQFGITKTLLKADRIPNPKKDQPQLDDDGRPMIDPDTAEPIMEPPFLLENERYDVERIHPNDFIVDENAGPLEDSVSFMAHRIKRRIEKVKKDNTRDDTYKKFVKPTESLSESDKVKEQRKKGAAFANQGKKTDAEYVVEWEVWDLENKKWFVVAEGCDYYGILPEDPPKGIERHPFEDLRFMPRDNSWYPIPPVSQLLDPMREYCERRSKLLVHAKRFNRKYGVYVGGLVDADKGLADLENGEDGALVHYNVPQPVVQPITDAPLDGTIHTELAYLKKDFEELSTGANQRGAAQGVDSATEAGIIEKHMAIREGDAVSLVVDFLTEIGRKLDQLVQGHISRDMTIRVVGPEGEAWTVVKQDDYREIAGEYEYSIQTGSTRPQLPELERSQMLGFLQILAGPGIIIALEPQLFKRLAESFGLDDQAVEAAGRLAQKMASGQLPFPGQQGSAPNTGGTPAAVAGGQAQGMANFRGGPQ